MALYWGMNRLLLFFSCLLMLATEGNSQNSFGYSKDTFLVNSGSNRMIVFGNWTNDTNFHYNRVLLPVCEFHSSPTLFSNCVYFDPEKIFRTDNAKTSGSKGFIMNEKFLFNGLFEHITPTSILMYLDTNSITWDYYGRLALLSLPSKSVKAYVQPFYFRKYEVSNNEYREFVNWVRDSIARVRLNYLQANGKIDWMKKMDWADSNFRKQTGMFLKAEGNFWHRPQINVKLLLYQFKNAPAEYGKDTINIYPDTLSWVHDFAYAYNEPMTNMYYWHPAYNDYPVVGVDYWQCLAFLEWKSKQLSQEFSKNGKHLRVECKLPSAAEWDYVTTAISKNGKIELISDHYSALCDNSWLTDLRLSSYPAVTINLDQEKKSDSAKSDIIYVPSRQKTFSYSPITNEEDLLLRGNDVLYGDFTSDGYFQTAPVDPNRKRNTYRSKTYYHSLQSNARYLAHTDNVTGISYLDGNVSEWMRNDLDSSWRAIFSKHISRLSDHSISAAAKIAMETENYYFKKLPIHGKLVRGGNWMDERYNNNYGKNTAGMNAKTFEDPGKTHCTLGFRYVIYVYPTNITINEGGAWDW